MQDKFSKLISEKNEFRFFFEKHVINRGNNIDKYERVPHYTHDLTVWDKSLRVFEENFRISKGLPIIKTYYCSSFSKSLLLTPSSDILCLLPHYFL